MRPKTMPSLGISIPKHSLHVIETLDKLNQQAELVHIPRIDSVILRLWIVMLVRGIVNAQFLAH
jgi:hypothetical protein